MRAAAVLTLLTGVGEIRFESSLQGGLDLEILFDSSTDLDGSMVWLALAGATLITDAQGVTLVTRFDNLAVYDAASTGGMAPPIAVNVPAGQCIGATEAKILP